MFELRPILGTPGETYLRDVRKIDTGAIEDVLERTDAIGWHPSVLFQEPGHALHGEKLGAIIGVMTDPVTAEPTGAISRTYIHEGRKVGKAKTLGSPAGIIRLSEDADVLERLHIAEGLETALGAMSKGLRPMWATGSTAIMAKLPVRLRNRGAHHHRRPRCERRGRTRGGRGRVTMARGGERGPRLEAEVHR